MILGLAGQMGAGKNEVAKRLAKLSPLPVVEVSYAKKLKESVMALLDITLDDIEAWKNDECRFVVITGTKAAAMHPVGTFREFLQRYGTESHRDVFGQDFWLDAAMPLDKQYDDALYVVTDMRFPNEAARVKELGGTTVYVIGPEFGAGRHASEMPIPTDIRLNNVARDDNFKSLDDALWPILASIGLTGVAS